MCIFTSRQVRGIMLVENFNKAEFGMQEDVKRVRLLKIWETLYRDTDEEHPIGTEALIQKLGEVGIHCVRATIYEDIKTLQKYGYEIFCKRKKQNEYYVVDRSITLPELFILMDAVQAASFVPQKKTDELVQKIADLAGSERGKVLKRNIVEFTVSKSPNEHVLYSVNEITQAILQKKKIQFCYFDYSTSGGRKYRMSKRNPENKKEYVLNPLGTVFDGGYYYLFGFDDYHESIVHYRVDRMDGVRVLSDKISVEAQSKRAELPERKRQLFSMFGGNCEFVEFCASRDLLDVVYDKFGRTANVKEKEDGKIRFSVQAQVSPTFLAWCCAFGDKLKVLAPENVVRAVEDYIQTLVNAYKEEK